MMLEAVHKRCAKADSFILTLEHPLPIVKTCQIPPNLLHSAFVQNPNHRGSIYDVFA